MTDPLAALLRHPRLWRGSGGTLAPATAPSGESTGRMALPWALVTCETSPVSRSWRWICHNGNRAL